MNRTFTQVVHGELERLSCLPANWDAQGALPIDAAIIAAARSFVDDLPDKLIGPSAVVPMAKGNLQFEWHDGPRSLELEFEHPNMIHYLKWNPEEDVEEEGMFPIQDVDRAAGLVRWF